MADINAELVDKRSPLFGIRWVKLKGNAVAAEEIADLMAPGRPLVTDETVNREMWPVRERPSGQRRLDVRIEPLLWCHPPLHRPDVDLAECGCSPQSGQFGEGNSGVVLVHCDKKQTKGMRVQTMSTP